MKFTKLKYGNMEIIMSDGGCTIVGDGWNLSLPSPKFDDIINKYGFEVEILKQEMIEYYKNFNKI